MKLIPKQQNGGSFLSLFADYTPLLTSGTTTSSGKSTSTKKESSDDSEKGKLTEKDLFSMLKDVDGLPNDMKVLIGNIQNMYKNAELFGSNLFDAAGLANLYSNNIYKLKVANFNKKQFDQAKEQVVKNEGLNELAVYQGKVVVYDKDGNLDSVDVKDYLNNSSEYQPITNEQLLYLRAHDNNLAYNNEVLKIVNSGIGINKIDELIRSKLSELGQTSNTSEGYTVKAENAVMRGLEVLQNADASEVINQGGLTVDGLYKSKIITKEQTQQAKAALNYIYSMLDENAKTILQLRSGNANNPDEGAKNVIANLIMSRQSASTEISYDYQDNLNINGSKKDSSSSSGKSLEDLDLTAPELFLQGRGTKELIQVNPGTNYSIGAMSSRIQLTNQSGDPLGSMCSLQEVSSGQFGGILDWKNATMGGRHIKTDHLKQVLVEDGNIYSVDFPVKEDGTPDFTPTTIEAKNKADQQMKAAGIDINNAASRALNADKINEILRNCGLSAAYDSDGLIVSGNWGRFAVFNGTSDGKALSVGDMDDTPTFLEEVEGDTEVDNIISILHEKSGLPSNQEYGFDKGGWFSSGDRIFKGTIFIPINANYFNAKIGGGSKISGKHSVELEKLQQEMDIRNGMLHQYNDPYGQ